MRIFKGLMAVFLILFASCAFAEVLTNSSYIISSDNIPMTGEYTTNNGTNLLNNLGETVIDTNGNALDYWCGQGFIHTLLSDAVIHISKSVSNIKLGGTLSTAKPGTTIRYMVCVTNLAIGDVAYNVSVFDQPKPTVTIKSNSWTTNTGWRIEWSTVAGTPNMAYSNNSDFVSTEPTPSAVTWFRWKKAVVPVNENVKFYISFIIK